MQTYQLQDTNLLVITYRMLLHILELQQ